MVNNTDYIFDAEKAIPRYGGVRDGTRLILYRWNGGKNQLWEIAPPAERAQHVRIVCQCNQDLSLAVRDGTAVLARTDHEEETQVGRLINSRSVCILAHRTLLLMSCCFFFSA